MSFQVLDLDFDKQTCASTQVNTKSRASIFTYVCVYCCELKKHWKVSAAVNYSSVTNDTLKKIARNP